jgi:copper chaperone
MTERMTLTVTGMSCGGCENAVTRAVSALAGVSEVTASHRDDRVTLTYDPDRVDRADVARRIEDAGYHVGPV